MAILGAMFASGREVGVYEGMSMSMSMSKK